MFGKTFKAIVNIFRGADDAAANVLKNNVRDAKIKIEDAKKKVQEFEVAISKHISSRIQFERKLKIEKENMNKWQRAAQRAIDKNDQDTARSAIKNKQDIKRTVDSLEANIKSSKAMADKFISQRDKLKEQIENAENNLSTLAAREKSADMNIEMSKAASDLQSGNLDLGLDDFENAVSEKESTAAAWDELADGDDADILNKYGDDSDSSVEDELAAMMQKKD